MPSGYELVRPLGSGAFGEVVLARQVAIDRLVAVKRILPRALSTPDNVERFRREAKVLASTDCRSVVKVFDLVNGPDCALLVMEYVPGQTLADRLTGGPLPSPEALRALRDVASALRHMADRGIVHRDVKPGNVFVLPDGHAKLGDFGLARMVSDDSAFRTAGGAPTGTPAYFPPEVSQGTAEPDARSDAYSFAVMAYEALTGRRPFDAPDALALVIAHWDQDPMPPREALPGISDAAAAALLAGLAKDPARRPLPSELIDMLEQVPEQAWPVPERTMRRPARNATTIVSATPLPAHLPAASPTAPPRERRRPSRSRRARLRLVLALVAVVGLSAAVALAVSRLSGEAALAVVSVDVAVAPDRDTCPRARYDFTAIIRTNGSAGTLRLQWVRPDGAVLPERELTLSSGQREVTARLEFTMSGRSSLEGEGRIVVLSPGSDAGAAEVSYACP